MDIPSRIWKTRAAVGLVSVGAALSLSSCGLLLPGRPGDAPPPLEEAPAGEESEEQAAPAGDGGEFRTGPIPSSSVTFDEELPEVDSDDPVVQVEGELVNMVQEFAMVTDSSTSASCDSFDASLNGTIDCTATFQGISIPFTVDIEGGEFIFSYTPTPTEGMVASRDVVEDEMRYMSDNESVRCTMDEFQLVPVDQTVPDLKCFAKGDPDEYEVKFSIYGSVYVSRVF